MIHSANEVKRALEERLQQHLDSHQRQVETLQAEISAKEAHISQVGVAECMEYHQVVSNAGYTCTVDTVYLYGARVIIHF